MFLPPPFFVDESIRSSLFAPETVKPLVEVWASDVAIKLRPGLSQ
jgi:hypothetical protein